MSRQGSRVRLFGIAALLGACCGAPALAQDPKPSPENGPKKDAPPKAEDAPKSGRQAFKRDQGTSAELAKHVQGVLAELGKRYPDWRYDASKAGTPVGGPSSGSATPTKETPKTPGGGLRPPPTKGPVAKGPASTRTPEEVAKDSLLQTLRGWQPTKEALIDVLTLDGIKAIGKSTYKIGKRTFAADEPRAIASALGIHPSLSGVKVYRASTEELLSMELETVSATEFASGLRDVARYLKPRYQFYVVTLDRPEAEKKKAPLPKGAIDTVDARLQLFAKSGKTWIYVGRIWRLEKDLKEPRKKSG